MEGKHQLLFKNIATGWISAFIIVILLATMTQAIIQYSLSQEVILRGLSSLISSQAVYSQRLQRDALLLLTPSNHDSIDREMQGDVTSMEANHARYAAQYRGMVPEIDTLPTEAAAAYSKVDGAVHALISLEKRHIPEKQRIKAELPFISTEFYSEKVHLGYIERSRDIVDTQTDVYIARTRLIELALYLLNLLVWLFEGVFISRLSKQIMHSLENEEREAEALSFAKKEEE